MTIAEEVSILLDETTQFFTGLTLTEQGERRAAQCRRQIAQLLRENRPHRAAALVSRLHHIMAKHNTQKVSIRQGRHGAPYYVYHLRCGPMSFGCDRCGRPLSDWPCVLYSITPVPGDPSVALALPGYRYIHCVDHAVSDYDIDRWCS